MCGSFTDYFSFVKGPVDSEDLSLNISGDAAARPPLQHIAKNIKNRIKKELERLLKVSGKYEQFFQTFGRQLKYGVYMNFGRYKEVLQDLYFYSSTEKTCHFDEYVARMPGEQKYIYYASGESIERISKMPQTERIADLGYEILYFTDDIDEFAVRMLHKYKGRSSGLWPAVI